jgi:hypothetical protein
MVIDVGYLCAGFFHPICWVIFGFPIIVWRLHSFHLAIPLQLFICGIGCSNMKLCICTVPCGGGVAFL